MIPILVFLVALAVFFFVMWRKCYFCYYQRAHGLVSEVKRGVCGRKSDNCNWYLRR